MKLKEDLHNCDWIDEPKRFTIPMPSAALTDRTEPYTAEELARAADTVTAIEAHCNKTTRRTQHQTFYVRITENDGRFELVSQRITCDGDAGTIIDEVVRTSDSLSDLLGM